MFMSRINLAVNAGKQPQFWQEMSTPYGAHQAIWKLFRKSADQTRDFLFRQDDAVTSDANSLRFHVLSLNAPSADNSGLWQIDEPKSFAPKLKAGDRLGFCLRVSPTKRKKGIGGASGKRCDVIMDAKKQSPLSTPFDLQATIQDKGREWLLSQSKNAGFDLAKTTIESVGEDGMLDDIEVDALKITGYRQHKIYKGKGAEPISFSTLDYEGVLIVTDPAKFLDKVRSGFGPQKAFGCGLMLLRRASRD